MTDAYGPLLSMDVGDLACDLRVEGLVKHYEGFTLGPTSLLVPRGSITGLIGQNGAGKTTLMKCVLATTHADAGTIELFGNRLYDLDSSQASALKQRLAFVNAITAYPTAMRVSEVARMYELAYPRFDKEEFAQQARRLELGDLSRQVGELSRGMGMKLQLACAFASGVDMLILDEPTSGLDPIVREEVLDILREWMEVDDHSILISSHITSDLDRLADYLVMIDAGRIVLSCEQSALESLGVARIRNAEMEQLFEGKASAQEFIRLIRRDMSVDVLVSDRMEFIRQHPEIGCDRASIDELMVFLAKGEVV